MSRHYIPANDASLTLVVGYDRPLNYFFAQGFPEGGEPFEITPMFRGVRTVEELAGAVAPYGALADNVRDELELESEGLAATNRIIDHRPAAASA